eukprot:2599937-Rhodomonas_salina.2
MHSSPLTLLTLLTPSPPHPLFLSCLAPVCHCSWPSRHRTPAASSSPRASWRVPASREACPARAA